MKTTNLHAHELHTPGIHVRYVYPLDESKPIVINGSLVIQKVDLGTNEGGELELIMLQKQQIFWKMEHHLTFENEDIDVSHCAKIAGGKFLGGHC